MKNFIPALFLFLALIVSPSLVAQSPQGIPYQAVMRNADGSVMASSEAVLTFMIHDGTANGTVVYQESHSLTSNAQGLVNCVVGNGVVSEGNFNSINWGGGAKFLHVMMNGNDLGTQQMLSVPYALYAGACDIQVSLTGDTLYTGGGNFVIIPGISTANFPPAVLGCTDNAACNYNSAATQNDNSCLYTGATCDDGNANTTIDVINGSCVCAGTAVGNGTYVPGNGATDIDGNTYTSIIINGQEWMQQNLAVTKYRNGDPIPTGLSDATWSSTTSGAYAIYNNDAANNTLYGKLYNWYALNDSRGLCPTGWHVPSDAEWTALETNLGGSSVAGGKMKATTGWISPNTDATNESGFTGLPGGYRIAYGAYGLVGYFGFWWSSTEVDSYDAWDRELYYNYSNVPRANFNKQVGFSVRCIKDSESSPIQGCTDGAACNFMANATQDDGYCLYLNAACDDGNANTTNDVINNNCQCSGEAIVNGCTDAQACNYNSAANVDNGSCLIQGAACNDNNANTTNDVINGSCVCAGTAVGNGTYVPGNGATDIDGNTYTSIIINGQEWMQQNLAVTKYRNGDPIPTGLSNTTWQNTTSGAYAIYNNDAANNNLYGKLYNWYAVNDSRGLCPTGWHVPSDAEWSAFINYLDPIADGGNNGNIAGGKMKSMTGWNSPNSGANNESGFTGLPGGYRNGNGSYSNIGFYGGWWSSSENGSNYAWGREQFYFDSGVIRDFSNKPFGFSVRCVRD